MITVDKLNGLANIGSLSKLKHKSGRFDKNGDKHDIKALKSERALFSEKYSLGLNLNSESNLKSSKNKK